MLCYVYVRKRGHPAINGRRTADCETSGYASQHLRTVYRSTFPDDERYAI